jgi:arginine:ornithine antiporter/lysine permease
MIMKRVLEASTINKIVTIANIVPILFFIGVLIGAFKAEPFRVNF